MSPQFTASQRRRTTCALLLLVLRSACMFPGDDGSKWSKKQVMAACLSTATVGAIIGAGLEYKRNNSTYKKEKGRTGHLLFLEVLKKKIDEWDNSISRDVEQCGLVLQRKFNEKTERGESTEGLKLILASFGNEFFRFKKDLISYMEECSWGKTEVDENLRKDSAQLLGVMTEFERVYPIVKAKQELFGDKRSMLLEQLRECGVRFTTQAAPLLSEACKNPEELAKQVSSRFGIGEMQQGLPGKPFIVAAYRLNLLQGDMQALRFKIERYKENCSLCPDAVSAREIEAFGKQYVVIAEALQRVNGSERHTQEKETFAQELALVFKEQSKLERQKIISQKAANRSKELEVARLDAEKALAHEGCNLTIDQQKRELESGKKNIARLEGKVKDLNERLKKAQEREKQLRVNMTQLKNSEKQLKAHNHDRQVVIQNQSEKVAGLERQLDAAQDELAQAQKKLVVAKEILASHVDTLSNTEGLEFRKLCKTLGLPKGQQAEVNAEEEGVDQPGAEGAGAEPDSEGEAATPEGATS